MKEIPFLQSSPVSSSTEATSESLCFQWQGVLQKKKKLLTVHFCPKVLVCIYRMYLRVAGLGEGPPLKISNLDGSVWNKTVSQKAWS